MRKNLTILIVVLVLCIWVGRNIYQSRDIWFGPSCEQVYEPAFKKVGDKIFEKAQLYAWAKENYSIDQSDIKTFHHDEANEEFFWTVNHKNYWAYFVQGHLQSIAVDWISPRLSANKVLECFGAPSDYFAYSYQDNQDHTYFELLLFYPGAGLIAKFGAEDMNKPESVNIPEISGKLPMSLAFVPSGTLKDLFENPIIGLPSQWQSHLKPWLGSWEGMSFERIQLP